MRTHIFVLAWSIASMALPLSAQQAQLPSVQAARMEESERIELDGQLSEAVWTRAPALSGFRQREPDEGAPASEETEVRIVYDHATLYVAVLARDREPDRVIARTLSRDRLLEKDFDGRPVFAGDDAVAILLDPFHDHRNAVILATNPNGAEFDALLSDEGREFNIDWRGVWEVRARRTAEGWSAEFAIPFRSLRYPHGADPSTWGLNVWRVIRRKNEEVLWSAWSRGGEGFHRVSRAGHLEGMRDLPRSGMNLEVKPFVLAGASSEAGSAGTEPTADMGVDLKYEVRPGLVLDVTANTDFAQVEVDDQQVNLTRFSLFYPEKRDFFLENAGVFEFGARGFFEPPPFLLFFSRRIGISSQGPVPVLGGARLTGRVGGQTVGLLNVTTDDAAFETGPGRLDRVPRTNFAVARVQRDVLGSGYVGAIVTDRRSADGGNTAGGVDFSLWPTASINVQGFAARTATSGTGGDGYAYRLLADRTGDRTGFNLDYLAISPDANAELGFITRTDIQRLQAFFRFTVRPRLLGLRKIDIFNGGQYITDLRGQLQDRSIGPGVSAEWNSGESLTLLLDDSYSRIEEPFDLAGQVRVPVGEYHGRQAMLLASTSSNRPVWLSSQAALQETYGGRVGNLTTTLNLAPGTHLAAALGYTRGHADLPGGDFAAHIGSLRLTYAFTTRLAVNGLVQYNSLDEAFSANLRLNFVHRPGSDLFIVLNEQRGSVGAPWSFDNRGVVAKVTYMVRL